MTNNDKQLEDILYGLIELEELGDDQIVAAVKNHPEHRDAILSFYEAWLTDDDGRRTHALAENEPEYVPDISGLWAQRAEIPDPFLNQPAMALRGIAQRCEIPLSILTSLEERGIQAATIPLLLIRRLAEEMKTTTAMLLDFLNQDRTMTASDFRSDGAPAQGNKVSFAEAVRSASMSDEARDKWLKLTE